MISDTDAFGMDAAFPAVLLALVLPSLRERAPRVAALVGATIAIGSSPLLPPGLPVLLSIAALPLAMLDRFRSSGPVPANDDQHEGEQASRDVADEPADPPAAADPAAPQ